MENTQANLPGFAGARSNMSEKKKTRKRKNLTPKQKLDAELKKLEAQRKKIEELQEKLEKENGPLAQARARLKAGDVEDLKEAKRLDRQLKIIEQALTVFSEYGSNEDLSRCEGLAKELEELLVDACGGVVEDEGSDDEDVASQDEDDEDDEDEDDEDEDEDEDEEDDDEDDEDEDDEDD